MTPAIQIQQVVKRYGGFTALAGVSLQIEQGEFFGLLGPNGAGKTTLISILAGLNIATSGSTAVMGHDVVRAYREARRALGVVPQELVFDPFFTVREALTIQSGYFGLRNNGAWIDELLHCLDLTEKADTNMRQLSGGMKRRVLIGRSARGASCRRTTGACWYRLFQSDRGSAGARRSTPRCYANRNNRTVWSALLAL